MKDQVRGYGEKLSFSVYGEKLSFSVYVRGPWDGRLEISMGLGSGEGVLKVLWTYSEDLMPFEAPV